jgi:hypothetical protein
MAKQIQGKYKRRLWKNTGLSGFITSSASTLTAPVRKGKGWSKRFGKKVKRQ